MGFGQTHLYQNVHMAQYSQYTITCHLLAKFIILSDNQAMACPVKSKGI